MKGDNQKLYNNFTYIRVAEFMLFMNTEITRDLIPRNV